METARPAATSLAAYLAVIRRRWLLVVIPVIIVPLAAVAFSLRQEKLYQASAKVLITNQNIAQNLVGQQVQPAATDPTRRANTETDVAEVPEIANRTLEALRLSDRTAQELLDETTVTPASDADILNFAVTDPRPGIAKQLVNEYAQQYIGYRRELDTAAVHDALEGLKTRIDGLESTIAAENAPDPALRQQLRTLLSTQQDLQTLEQLQGGKLFVIRAATDAAQTQPKVLRNAAIGLVLGLILGLGLAFLAQALDTRVRDADEASAILNLPLLGRIPPPPRSLARKNQLAMLSHGAHTHAESYRSLRSAFDLANLRAHARTIVITSALEREGKSTTVANLAIALARSGRHVGLVDLDLRRPLIAKLFRLEGVPGVTDVAIGEATLDEAVVTIPAVQHAPSKDTATSNGHHNEGRTPGILEVMASGSHAPGRRRGSLDTRDRGHRRPDARPL